MPRVCFLAGALTAFAAIGTPSFAHGPMCANGSTTGRQAQLALDPTIFFQKLVDRYRGLNLYRDVVTVVQVTHRDGRETNRVETRIECEVNGAELTVKTPSSQARQSLGIELPLKSGAAANETKKSYDLWLAPHMALKFTDQPLKQLRSGVQDGFTATEAQPVTIENKQMIHIELRSNCVSESESSETPGADCDATVDLYVNTDSMLIERIESQQRLPDGGSYTTTLQITPEELSGESPAAVEENSPPVK